MTRLFLREFLGRLDARTGFVATEIFCGTAGSRSTR